MRIRVSLSFVCVALFAVMGHAQVPDATLSGVIVNSTSNKPVAGAMVRIEEPSLSYVRTTSTNRKGLYYFQGIYNGTYNVRIQANGYKTTSGIATVGPRYDSRRNDSSSAGRGDGADPPG